MQNHQSIKVTETYNNEYLQTLLNVDTKHKDYPKDGNKNNQFISTEEHTKLSKLLRKKSTVFNKKLNIYTNQVEFAKKVYKDPKTEEEISYGRLYGDTKSIQSAWKFIRKVASNGKVIGFDLSNSQPNILNQLCKKYVPEKKFTHLDAYTRNRDAMKREIEKYYNCLPDVAKNLIIRLCFGGEIQEWKTDWDITVDDDLAFVLGFEKEMKDIRETFAQQFPEYGIAAKVFTIRRNTGKIEAGKCPRRSMIASYLQNIEGDMLLHWANDVLPKLNVEVATPIHDEINVLASDYVLENKDMIMRKLEQSTKEKFGFDVILKEENYTMSDDDKQQIQAHLLYEKETVLLDQITQPTIDMEKNGYDTETYSQKYCKSIVNTSKKYEVIVLRSHLGTGKSTAICDLVKQRNFKSILCITPRVMFANSIFADLKKAEPGFKLYKDIHKNDRPKQKFIVCQLESLTTLADDYELVIFDESESNFTQFHSKTTEENFDLITEKFETIMKNALNVLCADAFICNRTLCLMDLLRPKSKKIYIDNTFQPYKRVCNNIGKTDKQMVAFFDKFQKLYPDHRNIIATGSRKNSEALFGKVLDKKETLLINSYSSDTYAKELQNVNEFWDKYQNVIYTSSITVGVSYDSKKEFDNLFLHFSCFGCTVRDMFQASLRARNIKNNVLYYSNFSSYYGDDRPWIFEFDKLMETINHREISSEKKLKEWVKHLWCYNEKELNTNARYHEALINRYLLMCGYTKNKLDKELEIDDEVSVDDDVSVEEYVSVEFSVKNDDYILVDISVVEDTPSYEYDKIKNITWDDSEEIYCKIVKGQADTKDKLEYIKHDFNFNVLYKHKKIDLEIRKSMFQAYLQHKDKILEKLRNINYEQDKEYHMRCSMYHDNVEQKRESIMIIKNLLGIENSFDKNLITRDKLEIMRLYFNENVDYIQDTWKLDKKFWFNKLKDEPATNIHKRTIGTLQTIFSKWVGSDFRVYKEEKETQEKKERTRKRVDKKRVEVSNFETKPQKYIEAFVDNTKNSFSDSKECLIVDISTDKM